MRTIETVLYKFDELTPEAKENAIEGYRNSGVDGDYLFSEIRGSIDAFCKLFRIHTGRSYTDLRTDKVDSNTLELSGIRLYKYLMNNFGNDLFKPVYLKSFDREVKSKAFICKTKESKSGKYTLIYSKQRKDNSCVLTGVCWDNDILQPVYDFLKKPNESTDFEDLIKEVENTISKCFSETEDWLNSDEYIKDEIENGDYEFLESGELA